jgi:hypothetical protein
MSNTALARSDTAKNNKRTSQTHFLAGRADEARVRCSRHSWHRWSGSSRQLSPSALAPRCGIGGRAQCERRQALPAMQRARGPTHGRQALPPHGIRCSTARTGASSGSDDSKVVAAVGGPRTRHDEGRARVGANR